MRIVGAGFAPPDINAIWAETMEYEYELWSDLDQVIAAYYEVIEADAALPLRHAFILDGSGQAVVFHEGAISLGADPHAVLEDCTTLFGDTTGDGT